MLCCAVHILHARRPRCADASHGPEQEREKEKGDRRSVHLTHRSPYQSCDLRVRTTTKARAALHVPDAIRTDDLRWAYGGRHGRPHTGGRQPSAEDGRRPAPSSRRRRTITRDDSDLRAFGMRARVPQSLDVGEPGSAPPASGRCCCSTPETIDHRCARLVPRSLAAMNACACGRPRICGIGHGIQSHLLQRARVEHGRLRRHGCCCRRHRLSWCGSPRRPQQAEAALIAPLELRRWLVGEAPALRKTCRYGVPPTAPPQCLHAPARGLVASCRSCRVLAKPSVLTSFPAAPGLPVEGSETALGWYVTGHICRAVSPEQPPTHTSSRSPPVGGGSGSRRPCDSAIESSGRPPYEGEHRMGGRACNAAERRESRHTRHARG